MRTRLRSCIFLTVTVLLFAVAAYLDSVPNHRFGDGDWDMWLAVTVFPLMFFLHGVISGGVFDRFTSPIYFAATPPLFFFLFAIRSLFDSSLDFFGDLWRAVLGAVCYFAVSFGGYALMHIVKKAVLALVRYEKDRKERKGV